jgi:hypothetical protein
MKIHLLLSLLVIGYLAYVNSNDDDDKLAFVFEINRHGARAPLSKSMDPSHFKVGIGQLTASGMRQRMLLGKFNRQRYIDHYQLLDSGYNPN